MRVVALLALMASCASELLIAQAAITPPAAEAKEPVVKAVAEAVVSELAKQLEDNFVFPDKGKAYAAILRSNLAAGKYASFADADSFAQAITEDLQAVHKDGHLRVHVVPPEVRSGPRAERLGPPPNVNAISKSGWLAEGVAYVRFEGFPGNETSMAALRRFLEQHKDAKILIIDARSHRGGGLDEMDLMFPQLYARPTLLVSMDTRLAAEQRNGSPTEDQVSLRKVAGPEGIVRREHWVAPTAQPSALAEAKIYLLTAKRTASAGEHLSLSLKRTKRAILIGETTRGAGHYGGMVPLDPDFTYAAFIPVGRTFDPDTGEGWEGVGVKPDVEVPADKALDEALKLAGVSVSGEAALNSIK